jgi:hypothetical protein
MKILDMSAGNRAMWFDKNNPLATFLDLRPEVEPTIVCDTRAMPETVGQGYNLVVFDPPHTNFSANGAMSKIYGHHTGAEIDDTIRRSAAEAHRVSTPDALMAFKWSDRDKKLTTVLAFMSDWWEPLFGQIVNQRPRRATSNQVSSTWWVMLRKKA